MKKIILSILSIGFLYGADHALYTNSVEAVGGFVLNSTDSKLDDNWNLGFRYNYNRDTYSPWDVDSIQFAFDYSGNTGYLNGAGDTNVARISGNLLWYADNDSDFTPFALLGAGMQFFNNEKGGEDDGAFASFGGGIEYQMRGDVSLVGEGKWNYAGSDGDYLLGNFGIKYSFGN